MNRRITAILLSVFFALVLSCSNSARRDRNILRMNISSEPDSLNPWKSSSADSEAVWRNIFEGLMTFDSAGKIIPCLAEKVEKSADSLSYTFSLRKGIKFHNGKDFTSKDAVWTYENLAGLGGKKPVSAKFSAVKAVRADGDFEFTIELKQETPLFLISAIAVILPDGCTMEEMNEKPCGTGPYEFAEYIQNQKIVLHKNENYWDKKHSAKIPGIEIHIMTDETAVISALQSGQLDVGTMISGTNVKALENSFTAYNIPQNMVQILGMNNMVKPLNDERVRKAVALAVNRTEIIDSVFNGYATPLYSNFSPVLREYYNDSLEKVNAYDTEKAKELLKEAGYEKGFDITITVPANYQPHVDTAQIISSQLSKIGIRCIINPVEWATWLDQVYSRFNYEMTVIGFAGKLDPADILRRYYSTYTRNFTRFYNSSFDENFTKAASAPDHAVQTELYKNCQRILAEENPAVFICDPNQIYLAQKNVKGIEGFPLLFHNFAAWYFD